MHKEKRGKHLALIGAVLLVIIAISGVMSIFHSAGILSGAEVAGEADVTTPEESEAAGADMLWTILLLLAVFAVGLLTGFLYWKHLLTPARMRKKLAQLTLMMEEESLEVLKDAYLAVYKHYLKLSESQKPNFYAWVDKLREQIEEQLRAEKKMETLMQKSMRGSLAEQKKLYVEMHGHYQKLSRKTREKHYHSLAQLKDRLERGN
ncbi:MAG: hypothetical protein AABY26_06655 [Nanoarchaeota archaeon]